MTLDVEHTIRRVYEGCTETPRGWRNFSSYARRDFNRFAFDWGFNHPDEPCPHSKGSESRAHWLAGRDARLAAVSAGLLAR